MNNERDITNMRIHCLFYNNDQERYLPNFRIHCLFYTSSLFTNISYSFKKAETFETSDDLKRENYVTYMTVCLICLTFSL